MGLGKDGVVMICVMGSEGRDGLEVVFEVVLDPWLVPGVCRVLFEDV